VVRQEVIPASLEASEGLHVYLSYFDDGGKGQIKVFGGLVVDHRRYYLLERAVGFAIGPILGIKSDEEFELKGSDLIRGKGKCEPFPEQKRRAAVTELLQNIRTQEAAYIYSAVDTEALARSPVRSTNWMDLGFSMCALQVDEFIREEFGHLIKAAGTDREKYAQVEMPLSLIIVDDCDKEPKDRIKKSYRRMRRRLHVPSSGLADQQLRNVLDDMYFGDSAYSAGLQLADICNHIMWGHLSGTEDDPKLYEALLACRVFSARHEPEWSQSRHLLRAHDDVR
jgi:hypothetical protein